MPRRWRLYQPDLPDTPGAEVEVGPEESRHARKVLRLRAGEAVAVFDGDGREWAARMLDPDGPRVRLRLEEEILEPAVEPSLELALFQASLRPDRMDWVVQKATEVGVSSIRPFLSERAEQQRIGDERLRRWHRIAVESCKQCGRRRLPRIEPVEGLPPPPSADTSALLLHPSPEARPLADRCPATPPTRCWLAVGPQGGFSPEEIATLQARGWKSTTLGPRILRADTAGVVSAAILFHRWADLGASTGVC